MTKAWALILVLAILVLAGCGDEPSSGNDVRAHIVTYLGTDLHCLSFKGSDHGSFSGVSCDYVRFWRENEP